MKGGAVLQDTMLLLSSVAVFSPQHPIAVLRGCPPLSGSAPAFNSCSMRCGMASWQAKCSEVHLNGLQGGYHSLI